MLKMACFFFKFHYRACWLMMLLFMLGMMTEQLYQRINTFLSNPLAVNIEIEYEREVRFPSVVLCNENTNA